MNALCLSKDEERLHLLKEVAGTRVYEERREESNKIITETNSKRDKIQEVITYIEERLEELEGEKEELRAYQKCDREKRALEYTIYDKELRKAREQIDAVEDARANDQNSAQELHDRLRDTQDEIEIQKRLSGEAEQDLERLKRSRKDAERDRAKVVAQRVKLEVDVKEMEERVASDADQQKSLAEEAAQLDEEIDKVKEELNSVAQPAYEAAMEELARVEADKTQTDLQRNELLAKQGRGQRFTNEEERDSFLEEQLAGLNSSIKAKTSEVDKLDKRIHKAQSDLTAQQKAIAAKESETKKRQATMAKISEEITEKTERRHELAEERKARWQAKQEVDDEVKSWKESLQTHERDFRASMPRHIAQGLEAVERIVAEEKVKGYYGPLVENFELTNPKYRVPVEVAANNALFHVIVEDDNVASKLIKRLSKENLGRLTFMPLKQLQVQNMTYPSSSDVHPLMSVAIRYDSKVEKAMQQVFGKKLIARDFEIARKFARECNMDAITMDGDEVNRKGALEGGFHDERRSRLLSYAGIQEARSKLEASSKKQEDVQAKNLEVDSAVTQLIGSIQRDEAKKASIKNAGAQSSQEMKQMSEDVVLLEEQLEKMRTETLPKVQAELRSMKAQADSYKAEIGTALKHALSSAEQAELARLNEASSELAATVEQFGSAVENAAVERSRLNTLLKDNLLRQREEIREKLSSATGDGLGGDDEVGERVNALAAKKSELAQVSREAEDCAEKVSEIDKSMAEQKESMRAAKKALGELKAQEAQDEESLAEQDKQTEKQLNKRSMLVQKREENLRKIQQLGSLPASELEEYKDDSVRELMKKLHKANQQLTKYSHVNKKALDQYVNFSEQREALLERKTELDDGAAKIKELIEALDQQKDEAILRTFSNVAKHFSEVFKEIVPLGKGQLLMRTSADRGGAAAAGAAAVDDDLDDSQAASSSKLKVNDFEGVQVKVSFTPTGEVYLMSQLSGGQKALVALSIIFAIQRCDPAPFYLFDELDQALDSTYRAAVAAMIQRQANSDAATQFITTTFRPELVKVASKCYGISLQNKNSNIHVLGKPDALSFVADLMQEEEAVGEGSAAGAPQSAGKGGAKKKQKVEGADSVADDNSVVADDDSVLSAGTKRRR